MKLKLFSAVRVKTKHVYPCQWYEDCGTLGHSAVVLYSDQWVNELLVRLTPSNLTPPVFQPTVKFKNMMTSVYLITNCIFFFCSHCPISELPVVDNIVVIDFGESDLGFFLLFHLCKSVHLCCTDAAGGIYQWANMDTFPSLLKLRVKMHKHTPQTRDVRLICSNSDQKKSLKSDLGQ